MGHAACKGVEFTVSFLQLRERVIHLELPFVYEPNRSFCRQERKDRPRYGKYHEKANRLALQCAHVRNFLVRARLIERKESIRCLIDSLKVGIGGTKGGVSFVIEVPA